MWLITWFDNREQVAKSLQVHTAKSVSIVTQSLGDMPGRYVHVQVTRLAPRRLREVVIVFER